MSQSMHVVFTIASQYLSCSKWQFYIFLNPTHLFVSGRFVAVDADMTDDQDDEIGADTQRETTGVLLSPALEQGEWSCLRLVYQISGTGSLEVLQRTEGRSFDRPLWSSQVPSDSWVISSMDLQNNTEPYRVKQMNVSISLTRRPAWNNKKTKTKPKSKASPVAPGNC